MDIFLTSQESFLAHQVIKKVIIACEMKDAIQDKTEEDPKRYYMDYTPLNIILTVDQMIMLRKILKKTNNGKKISY